MAGDHQGEGYYDGSILWGGGSVVPVSGVFFQDDMLFVMRTREVKRKDAADQHVRTHQFTELIAARVDGDVLSLEQTNPRDNGEGMSQATFTGKRIPPLPPRPDLSKVKYGEPVPLFNGQDLTGWRLLEAGGGQWLECEGRCAHQPARAAGRETAQELRQSPD